MNWSSCHWSVSVEDADSTLPNVMDGTSIYFLCGSKSYGDVVTQVGVILYAGI